MAQGQLKGAARVIKSTAPAARPLILALLLALVAGCSSRELVAGDAEALAPKCFTTAAVPEVASETEDVLCRPLPSPAAAAAPADAVAAVEGGAAAAAWPTCGLPTGIAPDRAGACPDAQAALDAHNAARAQYGAPPLLWSKTLADYAQGVSDTCRFAHSNGPYGENLAIGTGLTCAAALELWMREAPAFDYAAPGFSSATGHFTAVVWKATVQVGCGVRACAGRALVTCSYYKPGNVIGQFGDQVGRPGSAPECTAPPPGAPAPAPAPAPTPSPSPSAPPTTPPSAPPPPAAKLPAGFTYDPAARRCCFTCE